jgi:hypothetical protein
MIDSDIKDLIISLSADLPKLEKEALIVMPSAYDIKNQANDQYIRIKNSAQFLAEKRLNLAYLMATVKEPDLEEQLSSINIRYEALENFYESALDRIVDYDSAKTSLRLERIIIVILALEFYFSVLKFWIL